jgi:predicted ATPase
MALEHDKLRRVLRLDRDFERRPHLGQESDFRLPLQVVPTRNMTAQKVATLWDTIGLSDLSQEVVKSLNLIAPEITDIGLVESMVAPRERIPLVRVSGSGEPLPLRSMGDGITRLFHITLALANARNGILLIDEFENGLHWSIQREVWNTIFRLADILDVQVFASTHSRDCIQGFADAWINNSTQGSLFRLDAGAEGPIRAKSYTLETLNDSLDTAVEIR